MTPHIRQPHLLFIFAVVAILNTSCKKEKPHSNPVNSNPNTSAQWVSFNEDLSLYKYVTDIEQGPNGTVWVVYTNGSGQSSTRIIGYNNAFHESGRIDSSDSPYLLSKISSIGFYDSKIFMGAQFNSSPDLSKEILVLDHGFYSHFPATGGTGYNFENFYFNNDGLWYGTGNNGLINFDGVTFEEFDSGNSAIPYPNYVKDIFRINDTDFWFFTSDALLKKTSTGIELVRENFYFNGMDVDSNNDFWLISEVSEILLKLSGNTETTVQLPSGLMGNVRITDLVVDDFDNIWVSTGITFSETGDIFANGLFRYKDSVWTHYTPSNSQLQSLNLTTLNVDGNGNLWVGSRNAGVICITKLATDE